MTVSIRAFQLEDSTAMRALIEAGLEQRFGFLLEDANPDLTDFQAYYLDQGASLIVVERDGGLIGCGALIREQGSDVVGRLVRVSVAASQQGRGLGRLISQRLIEIARERGFRQLEVETNSDWESALHLYKSLGFVAYKRVYVPEYDFTEVHMHMDLIS